MIQTQSTFCDYLDNVKKELDEAGSSGFFEEIEKNIHSIESLKQDIAKAELIVPVVGAFSTGKSTLINSFLGSGLLPVDITPETALATELHYSEREYIEAVKADDESDSYDIADIGAINEKAQQYKYVKIFLNSAQLQGILPLVLVDMPGFDSPLDLHQRAILTYLARGSHYAVLISVEEGTVTRSIHRQLSEFYEFDKTFSIFLSKANLRSDSEVGDIARNIKERLEEDFDFADSVVSVGKDGREDLEKMLKAIDPEELFGKLWRPHLEAHFFLLDGSLNTCISSLKKDSTENQEVIDELASDLRNLQSKKEKMIEDLREKYATTRVSSIVNRVGEDLSNSVEELTSVAINSGEAAFQRHLSGVLRSSLINHVNIEMRQLNRQIVEDLSGSLKGIDRILSSSTIDKQKWEELLPQIQEQVNKGKEYAEEMKDKADRTIGEKAKDVVTGEKGRNLYRPIATILAITTNVVGIALELAIVFLPDILRYIQKWKQEKQIRNQLIGTFIPSIKNELKSKLPEYFNEQVDLLINENAEFLDSQIKAQQSEIAAAEKAKKDEIRDVEQTIAELTSIRENIRLLANQVIFTQ